MLQPGEQVTPNVRLVRMLGEGGMGSVWVGFHQTLRTEVAVKFMSADLAQDAAALARFSREAAAAAQIKSPHVVQTYDHGVTPSGVPFIVMELLEGEDLRQRIKRLGGVGLQDTVVILTQACKALGRAHAAGIVHRDVKPDNIFLVSGDDDIFVKILDFGIAKKAGSEQSFRMTATGAMIGTPYYMSPDQLLSAKDVDLRADLWSLGVVVYHCLTGRVPFDGETLAGLCVNIEKAQFQPLSQLNVQLPPSIDTWFARAMARNREDRFGSAKEMAESFASAALGGVVPPMHSIPDARASQLAPATPGIAQAATGVAPPTLAGAAVTVSPSPSKTRMPIVVGLFAAAVVILVGGLGAWFLRRPSAPDESVAIPEADASALVVVADASAPDLRERTAAAASAVASGSVAVVAPPPSPEPSPARTSPPSAKTSPAKTAPAKTAPAGTAPGNTKTSKPPPPPTPTVKDRGF